ncbi:MAG: acyl-CoA dehydrogenase family protein, partial [Deltaproteobacteria bacterium]|nr:acyl-CoA dehydrogenase family protein [Deltaproteobacteria bacterium]
MTKINCTDFYDMGALLSEEEARVQQTAREFSEKEILPIINKHHRDATFPKEIFPKMGRLGFLGPTLPEEYGCAGLN